ncbi:MAG: ACP S-malonyltransferase [Candidatus Omnitrophota bacterium]|jgi:[acyl-carrier-protein] S-malonyltransferase
MDRYGYLFAGQGAQYAGMGKDLYESFRESKAVFDKADDVLKFPLSKLCFEGPIEELTRTGNCQPAILTVSIAAWEAFKHVTKHQILPGSFAAGLSLGEYSALVFAQAVTFEDAVRLLRSRGEFMEEEAVKKPGKMLSIIGLDLEKIKEVCKTTGAEIANINCPGQVVISGGMAEIKEAERLACEMGAKRSVLLEVSGAFHSSFMKNASVRLSEEISKINFSEPKIPVISNVTARPFSSVGEIRENLVKQVYSSVLWESSLQFMLSNNIRRFFELGPGRVLRGLMRYINNEAQVINIAKKQDIFNFKMGGDDEA